MVGETKPAVRGLLVHLTHYDPGWVRDKDGEKPFDLRTGLEVVQAAASAGLNLLVIDCADGVKYRTHPELERPYTVLLTTLGSLAEKARSLGLELVPKLNFSRSRHHRHNDWFMPHTGLFDTEEYWKLAFEVMDELIEELKPERFFHIGMDEDHDRAHSQYIEAIERLHEGLSARGLRPIVWNDSAHGGPALVHAEKCRAAERAIPKDVVEVLWDYHATAPEHLKRLVAEGFEVWGAPGPSEFQARAWRDDVLKLGGKGLLMTRWIPMRPETREELVGMVRRLGPLYGGG